MDNKKRISRRDFLKMGGAAAATAVATMVPSGVYADIATKKKARLAMLMDLRRCTGCHACSIACKAEFEVFLGVWRSWVEQNEVGKYPATKREMLPRLCNHCNNPPCVPVCPVNATHARADGTVVVDEDKCIGCKTCMAACPYNARFLNPDKGVINKCDFCLHRIANGVVPACVNTCPANARVFGNLDDPNSEISKLLKQNKERIFTLKPKLGTEPQVFYIKREG